MSVAGSSFARTARAVSLVVAAAALLTGGAAVRAELGAQGAPRDTARGAATPGAIAHDASAFARRVGLWASLGLGRGQAGLSCPTCTDDRRGAYALQGAIGGRVHPRFHVGVESWAWLDVFGGGVDRTARGVQLIARHYPLVRSGLFLGGGAGVSTYTLDDGEIAFRSRAPTVSLAVGWDIAWRGVVLSPTLTAMASTGGPLESDATGNALTDNARLGFLRSSVSVSWF